MALGQRGKVRGEDWSFLPHLNLLGSLLLALRKLFFPSLTHIALPYPGLMPDSGEHVPVPDCGERIWPHNVCIVFVHYN